jgi:hypothetical protein
MEKFNKNKNTLERITNGLDQSREQISWVENKVEELLHSDSNKEKISNNDHNFQELWEIIK